MGLSSADRIVEAWQGVQPGDRILISPVTPMDVAMLEPEQALALHTVMDPFSARVIEPGERRYAWMDWSWAFLLEPAGARLTRLIIRVRANLQPQPLGRVLAWLALEPIHFVMERKMLLGIRRRAEAYSRDLAEQVW